MLLPKTSQKMVLIAQVLVLGSLLFGLQFLLSTTGGTLFVHTSIGGPMLGLAVAIVGYIGYMKFKSAHGLFTTKSVAEGDTIFHEGDAGDSMFFIREGEVEVIRGDSVIATLGKGEYFGEMALLSTEKRNATVRATKNSQLASLGKGNFLDMVDVLPSTEQDILATIQQRAMQVD